MGKIFFFKPRRSYWWLKVNLSNPLRTLITGLRCVNEKTLIFPCRVLRIRTVRAKTSLLLGAPSLPWLFISAKILLDTKSLISKMWKTMAVKWKHPPKTTPGQDVNKISCCHSGLFWYDSRLSLLLPLLPFGHGHSWQMLRSWWIWYLPSAGH